jgi:hypothetical protein
MSDKTLTSIEVELAPVLGELGLFSFGWFVMPDAPFTNRKAMLIGNRVDNDRHVMWDVFTQSPEYLDGKPNPLNRWTQRTIGDVATRYKVDAIYPFGETIWPFQRYAKAATGMKSSPLGMLIHPEFGLWQAFRAVMIFGEGGALDLPHKLNHPCEACAEKPCLKACPVNAFTDDGFAVDNCRTHLQTGGEPNCMTLGCRARAACPVGAAYSKEQIQFHMKAFSH